MQKHSTNGIFDLYQKSILGRQTNADCESSDPADTVTDRLNTLLNSTGPGYVLQLCPGSRYLIKAPISFAFPGQEISTLGYPVGDERATLVVSGPTTNGQGHTIAVDGTCANCSGVKLRHVQIDGNRGGGPPTKGGANIEMGGSNSDQIIEFVRSVDPRDWSCMHIAEGDLTCRNVTVQNNDIGPCGSDNYQEWADGVSLACSDSIVQNNMIQGATDGGIVIFGSPGSLIYNNTIWITNQILLGGINMVDYTPFMGDYSNVLVYNNIIQGGFSTDQPEPGKKLGSNSNNAIIKIGIAIGPRTWFGDRYGNNVSHSGTVIGNSFSGAFSYAIGVTSAQNFTFQGNFLSGSTSFVGVPGPNCSSPDTAPSPTPWILDPNTTDSLFIQTVFEDVPGANSLICIVPPDGGNFWPFKLHSLVSRATILMAGSQQTHTSGGGVAGIIICISLGLICFFIAAFIAVCSIWISLRKESGKFSKLYRF